MISQLFLLFWVIAGTHLGLGLGFADDNPPTGLLTKTQPGPWAGFSRAGLGGGRVLARPTNNRFGNTLVTCKDQRVLSPEEIDTALTM